MGVTSYYSFGGEIIGEETGGVRRDYLTDALGSVTATVTGAGVVENTYRYKPYGETLAKTGTGSDPKFLWNGSTGSQKTKNKFAGQYNRARNYNPESGSWISGDPLHSLIKIYANSYLAEINKYSYSVNNPVNIIDPSGYLGSTSCISGRIPLDKILPWPWVKVLRPILKFQRCMTCYKCDFPGKCTASVCEKVSFGFCIAPFNINFSDLLGVIKGKQFVDAMIQLGTAIVGGSIGCIGAPEKGCPGKSDSLSVEANLSACDFGIEAYFKSFMSYKEECGKSSGMHFGTSQGSRFSNCGAFKLELCVNFVSEKCE